MLFRSAFDAWLDCRAAEITPAVALLRPAADDLLEVQEVDPILNNSRNEGAQVLKQVGQIPLL